MKEDYIKKSVQDLDDHIFSVIRELGFLNLGYIRDANTIHFPKDLFYRDILLNKSTFYRYVKFMNCHSGHLYCVFYRGDKCFIEYCGLSDKNEVGE